MTYDIDAIVLANRARADLPMHRILLGDLIEECELLRDLIERARIERPDLVVELNRRARVKERGIATKLREIAKLEADEFLESMSTDS